MNDQRARELFLDLHRGFLSPAEAEKLHSHLAANPELQREFDELTRTLNALDAMPLPTPGPRLRAGVFAAIEAEKRAASAPAPTAVRRRDPGGQTSRRSVWFWLIQPLAACALLALGFLAGTRHTGAPGVAPAAPVTNTETQRELADLRQQVESIKTLVVYPLLQEQQRPTNDRLKAVLASARLENPNDKVINELIGSLALDPSTNVRLMALDALYSHSQLEVVRAGVLASLPREQSPLVQVAMIDFLVAAREREAGPALDKISRSDSADISVRNAATRALTQL
ncbi:MAG TPA: HEAT repeat domain-containing protein [Opitutaceae bacterium]|nr:HEAT repeat domain-containing protein [Opitutaceae bacterium]